MTLLFRYLKIFDELENDGPLVGEGGRNTLMCCLGSLAMNRRIIIQIPRGHRCWKIFRIALIRREIFLFESLFKRS